MRADEQRPTATWRLWVAAVLAVAAVCVSATGLLADVGRGGTPPAPAANKGSHTAAAPTSVDAVRAPHSTHTTPSSGLRFATLGFTPLTSYRVTFVEDAPLWLEELVADVAAEAQRWSGISLAVGGPASLGTVPEVGEIRVSNLLGCADHVALGCTVPAAVGDVLTGADVAVYDAAAHTPHAWDVAAHELAHALGLDHVELRDGGQPQVMGNPEGVVLGAYQPGDRAGLGHVGSLARAAAPRQGPSYWPTQMFGAR